VGHIIQSDGDGQDYNIFLIRRYLDAVRVAYSEPLLGDLGDLVTPFFNLILVI
jgi:hypothetical protein